MSELRIGNPGSLSVRLKLGALHVLYRASGEVRRTEIEERGWPHTQWRDDWGCLWSGDDPRLAIRRDAMSRSALLAAGLRQLERMGLIASRVPEGYRHKLYRITERGREWLEADAEAFEQAILSDLQALTESPTRGPSGASPAREEGR